MRFSLYNDGKDPRLVSGHRTASGLEAGLACAALRAVQAGCL